MIFAVDFDGTLSFGRWPGCGPANEGLIEFLKKRKSEGDKLILWTCREGADLSTAVDWCMGNGLSFDAVNDNLPEVIEQYGGNSRKVSCDFYIDDRAISGGIYKLFDCGGMDMADSKFATYVKEAMVKNVKKEKQAFLGGTWNGNGDTHDHIFKDNQYEHNFIENYPIYCDVKGNLSYEDNKPCKIKYHRGAANLNSSQVMCINFFWGFFRNKEKSDERENILLQVLEDVGVRLTSKKIQAATFEYEPNKAEKTNFDFCILLDNGSRITMEIKYTESEFGGITSDKDYPTKYDDKWDNVYKKNVKKNPYTEIANCSKEYFYKNYQINRNIYYAKEGDIVLFITPEANKSPRIRAGRDYINSFEEKYGTIRNILWEDLVANLMLRIKDDEELMKYYTEFKEKYIDILDDFKK